ncbi:hypothetical protein HY967_02295 [Candidatus Jorgensenbacteria bacterium]|nr:hypothetical protein [Candidatus Jorgensenbacteria bacterium]
MTKESPFEVIIVSDVHLGSRVSRAKQLLQWLKSQNFKKLILNGDIFDDLNIKWFLRDDWEYAVF